MNKRKLCFLLILISAGLLRAESSIGFGVDIPQDSPGALFWGSSEDPASPYSPYGELDEIFVRLTDFDMFERTCFHCSLFFDLGTFKGTTANSWLFNPGGMFKLIGGIDLDGSGDRDGGEFPEALPDGSIPTLASGTFTGTPTISLLSYNSALDETVLRLEGLLTGSLDSRLADALGFVALGEGSLWLDFAARGHLIPGDNFEATSILGGQQSLNNLSQAPEPSSILLLGAAMLAFWRVIRRRQKNERSGAPPRLLGA